MAVDLSALEAKLALHIGKPVVVVHDTRGNRMPVMGVVVHPKVFVSTDGLRAVIPMRSHFAFDMVARRSRVVDRGIPIDSLMRYMDGTMLDKLICVGELEIRRLRKELEKSLAEGPGDLVDVRTHKISGNPDEERSRDPLWQIAHMRDVATFKAVLEAEIAMITEALHLSL